MCCATGLPLFASPEVFADMVRHGEVELIGGSSVDWVGVPLKVQDKVIGVIAVQTYSEHVRLTEEHRDLLGFVSTQVAMAIQRKQTEQVRVCHLSHGGSRSDGARPERTISSDS